MEGKFIGAKAREATQVNPQAEVGRKQVGQVRQVSQLRAHEAVAAEVRLYERLFTEAQPDAGGRGLLEFVNPHSMRVVQAFVEPSSVTAAPDQRSQFERHGYFVSDRVMDHRADKPVFNQIAGLKDAFVK